VLRGFTLAYLLYLSALAISAALSLYIGVLYERLLLWAWVPVAIVLAAYVSCRFKTTQIVICNRSLAARVGAFRARTKIFRRNQLEVIVTYKPLGRLLDVGTVELVTFTERIVVRNIAGVSHILAWAEQTA